MGWKLHELPTQLKERVEDAFRTGIGVESRHASRQASSADDRAHSMQGSASAASRDSVRPARPLGPPPDSESELHDDIVKFCHERGWLCITSRMDKRTTTARGVSDFVILAPQTVYFVEAKMPGKKMTPAQQAFAAHIHKLNWPHSVVHSFNEFLEFIEGRQ